MILFGALFLVVLGLVTKYFVHQQQLVDAPVLWQEHLHESIGVSSVYIFDIKKKASSWAEATDMVTCGLGPFGSGFHSSMDN